MLLNLHVKNLALIDEADIYFDEGLNILTGETGAGKSILLGSVSLALGGKASRDIIGKHGDYASVELLFQVEDKLAKILNNRFDMDIQDGQVLVSRKFTENRNIMKINGENVTMATAKEITSYLIDIHGQHEHQSLLYPANHLTILDRFARDEIKEAKEKLKISYHIYKQACNKLNEFSMDEEERLRTIDFLEFEINEIESASIKVNEDVELEKKYKKANSAQRIIEQLSEARECLSDGDDSAADNIGRSFRAIEQAARMDEELTGLVSEIADIENLLGDLCHELSSYMGELEFDSAEFASLEERLDLINNLKAKHGGSIESVMERLAEKKQKFEILSDYEINRNIALKEKEEAFENVVENAEKLSVLRKEAALVLQKSILSALKELNFLSVDFKIDFKKLDTPSENGVDYVEFLISVNPGESVKPLAKVASGGELSRVMLAIKTVLADKDEIDTLIFDEIDTGISGRTAQMVADKLVIIGRSRQVLCITHLPQIAAMADRHFEISKEVKDNLTVTSIRSLDEEHSIMELARLLGGINITDAVVSNARELKHNAALIKKKLE